MIYDCLSVYQSVTVTTVLSCTIFEIFDAKEHCDLEIYRLWSVTL